jgi:hypothetical protein
MGQIVTTRDVVVVVVVVMLVPGEAPPQTVATR